MKYAFAFVLLLAACGDRAATRAEAIAAAESYLIAHRHHVPGVVDAIDMGDRWRLAYSDRPGEGGTGGVRLVVVNKRSGEVVHAEADQ